MIDYTMTCPSLSTVGRLFGFLCLLTLTSSCSQHAVDPQDSMMADLADKKLAIDVFSARGFLGGSEYERYYLKDDVLWRECGTVRKTLPADEQQAIRGDAVLKKDPNLEIEQRRIERVSEVQTSELKQRAAKVVQLMQGEDTQLIPPPGPFFSLSEPGVFEIQISLGDSQSRIITSVDAVAEQESPALERTHELFATVRGVGPTICQSPTFFGIARR